MLAAVPATSAPFAGRIDAGNVAVLRPGGLDGIGGIGDWALTNGALCAVVSDPGHESDLSTRGGMLVDLGRCGGNDDQWILLQPLVNFSQDGAIPIQTVRAKALPGAAWLTVGGEARGLSLEIRYELDLEHPERLRIATRVLRAASGERLYGLAHIVLHTEHALRPFSLVTGDLAASRGFRHAAIDVESPFSVVRAAHVADLLVLVGAGRIEPGISYGRRLVRAERVAADGVRTALQSFTLAGEQFSGLAVFARPFWVGGSAGIGLLEIAQAFFMDLPEGDALTLEEEIWVGERSDTASVTDLLWPEAPLVRGSVDDASARVHVEPRAGGAVALVQPEPGGSFALRLPVGEYALRAVAPGGRETRAEVSVPASGANAPELELPEAARLELPDAGAMRLVLRGVDGTPDPLLRAELLDFRMGDSRPLSSLVSNDVHLGGTGRDPRSVVLAPGRYRVLASRGPEFSVSEARIELAPGETRGLEIPPPVRAVPSPGWIAADLHVHAGPSDDSALPLDMRAASYLAQGAEVLVATDHEHVTDYGPVLGAMGARERMADVVGVEVTSSVSSPEAPFTAGHLNVFPMPYRENAYRKGAPHNEGRRPRDVLAAVRGLPGARVVQLNHPREQGTGPTTNAYLTHLGVVGRPFEPGLPLQAEPNRVLVEPDPETGHRDIDLDAIELLNGSSLDRYRAVREDWFALLRQGEILTATANSDSHRLEEVAALPRTYVRMTPDTPAAFDEAAFVDALLSGAAYGTTGPLLDVRLGDAGLGGRFLGSQGRLSVDVQAADWVPVSELRVYVDGALREVRPLSGSGRLEVPLSFEHDGFVVVEVLGEPGDVYRALLPGFTPLAFSNPIFVDADVDGIWTPPGLEEMP
jgi:hypothetical protein